MIVMSNKVVLERFMTALAIGFKRALHYHNKGYDSDSDYELPGPSM